MTQPQIRPTPIRRTVTVKADPQRSFAAFTANMGAWWPASHTIGGSQKPEVVLEGRVGGRWYERNPEGAECEWGKVLVWDPPGRIVLSWAIGADFKYDPALSLEVEVRFVALGPASTRIELEHRNFERLGDAAEGMRAAIDSEAGWTGVLQAYAARAAG